MLEDFRYKASRVPVNDRVQLYGPPPKYNALILPPSEKEYETQVDITVLYWWWCLETDFVAQMLEVAVIEEELNGRLQNGAGAVDLDFTVEEGIYSIQPAGRLDPFAT